MKYAQHFTLTIVGLLFVSIASFAQDNAEKIKGKWIFEKLELTRAKEDPGKAHQMLENTIMEFDGKEMQLSRKESDLIVPLKKGPYQILGNALSLGDSIPAEILELTDKKLVFKIPDGIMYYRKM